MDREEQRLSVGKVSKMLCFAGKKRKKYLRFDYLRAGSVSKERWRSNSTGSCARQDGQRKPKPCWRPQANRKTGLQGWNPASSRVKRAKEQLAENPDLPVTSAKVKGTLFFPGRQQEQRRLPAMPSSLVRHAPAMVIWKQGSAKTPTIIAGARMCSAAMPVVGAGMPTW